MPSFAFQLVNFPLSANRSKGELLADGFYYKYFPIPQYFEDVFECCTSILPKGSFRVLQIMNQATLDAVNAYRISMGEINFTVSLGLTIITYNFPPKDMLYQ